MKLFSIAAILAPSSISDAQDDLSFDPRTNDPVRKIMAIGAKIDQWTRENLCNDVKCLPAIDKPEGNWEQRIDKLTENLKSKYEK